MISKLPDWAWTAAWWLAFVAGMVNVVGLLSFQQQAITHLTGSTSLLAVAVTSLDGWAVLHFMGILGAFLAGTALSGLLIGGNATLRLRRRYGVGLLVESGLLLAAMPLLQEGNLGGIYLTGCASGLQNGMGSIYSSGLVRTTHLTGILTDLGLFLGHALRRVPVDPRRVRLCLLLISGFFAGGIAGTAAFSQLGPATLLIPATLTGGAALAYGAYRLNRLRLLRQYA
ncbi:MAG: hypothetical protein AVDCRST_MAG56-620 [uncultured Cytophagales bacterium]|uniref:Transmembrane protein n=1 Tax=uncultured Cytophagales bacterium TaxID=158755 RepID=A0A6J4HL39_9SPHI|nr:MAG: hypothetical protein AVDCRST_MAG56-620 [uncultured Cytophagales bacterium]